MTIAGATNTREVCEESERKKPLEFPLCGEVSFNCKIELQQFISEEERKMASLKFSELFSFAWSFTNGKIVEYYRQYLSEVVTVVTKSGPVKGYKMPSSFEYEYVNFFGIPYAKPPVGDLRFKVIAAQTVALRLSFLLMHLI